MDDHRVENPKAEDHRVDDHRVDDPNKVEHLSKAGSHKVENRRTALRKRGQDISKFPIKVSGSCDPPIRISAQNRLIFL